MFEGQPKGLYALALANTGERFGYYTMLAVFALFLRANFGLTADVGVEWTMDLLQKLMEKAKEEGLTDPKKVNEELVDLMFVDYVESGDSVVNDLSFTPGKTTVLLMEGVNGVGKTTTIAKLAHRYQQQGKRVLLAAADTFRAGAVEQLKIWADRLHCPIVTGPEIYFACIAERGFAILDLVNLCFF